MGLSGVHHPAHDRARDYISRGEISHRVHIIHEPVSGAVHEDSALTADGFGDKRLLPASPGA